MSHRCIFTILRDELLRKAPIISASVQGGREKKDDARVAQRFYTTRASRIIFGHSRRGYIFGRGGSSHRP